MRKRFANGIRTRATLAAEVLAMVILATAILMPAAIAQGLAAGRASGLVGIRPQPPASGSAMPGSVRAGSGPAHLHRGASTGRSAILLPYPYYYSDYGYPGSGYDSEAAAQPVPAAAPAQPAAPAPPTPPLQPLLIEWQGDHFERMTPQETTGAELAAPAAAKSAPRLSASNSYSSASSRPARKGAMQPAREAARAPAPELPPAILVFRDGRMEEVNSYTIISGTIYSKADYWSTGSWTKKIQIADLDVPATLKLNHDHGLNFVLPASPNEVVTRP